MIFFFFEKNIFLLLQKWNYYYFFEKLQYLAPDPAGNLVLSARFDLAYPLDAAWLCTSSRSRIMVKINRLCTIRRNGFERYTRRHRHAVRLIPRVAVARSRPAATVKRAGEKVGAAHKWRVCLISVLLHLVGERETSAFSGVSFSDHILIIFSPTC